MPILKHTKSVTKKPKCHLVNANPEFVKKFTKFNGKTLVDIDATEALTSITLGTKEYDGSIIRNLVLGYAKEKFAFPLSRGFGDEVADDKTLLLDGAFYLRKKESHKDDDGNAVYEGDPYISFGKPDGINFDEEESLEDVEIVDSVEEEI